MDNMQLWLSSSTDSINLNDSAEGFYLNPDLEGLTGLPEIRSVNGLNAGYDGGWTATQLWAARLITIRGVIAINDKAAVEDKRKALAKILSQGKNEDLELKFVSEAGNTYTTTVRTSYCTMALQRVFWRQEYQIQLRANDPLIYDDGGSELIAILRVMAGEGGFEIPFDIPFDIGGSITPTSVDVGDEATYPLIRLKGDLHNPTIINMTTNQRMQVLADIITTIEWHDYTTTYTTNGYKQIGDALDGAPLSLTHLYGNATQKTLSGKNLLKYPAASGSATISGVQFTQSEDGKVVATGTTLAGMNWWFYVSPNYFVPTESGQYTLSFTGQHQNMTLYCYDTTAAAVAIRLDSNQSSSSATGELTVGHNYQIYFNQGLTGKAVDINGYAQLEKGNTATAYEPYCGGVPSPNPSYPQTVKTVTGAQTVKITGKNLFDQSADEQGSFNYITGILGNNNNRIRTLPIECFPNTEYTISANQSLGEWAVIYYAEDGTFIRGEGQDNITTTSKTWTSKPNAKYMRIRLGSDSYPMTAGADYNIMLSADSTAQAYEPYQAQSQEINLGGTNLFSFNIATLAQYPQSGINISREANSITITSETTTGAQVQYTSFIGSFDASKTYTLSGKAKKIVKGTDGQPWIFVRWRGSNDGGATWSEYASLYEERNPTQGTEYNFSGQVSGFTTYQFLFYNNPSTPVSLGEKTTYYNIMLNEGSTALPFAPYTTYAYELAKIGNYQDYIWNDNGTWKIHKEVGKVVLTGDASESWAYVSGEHARFQYSDSTIALEPSIYAVGAVMSDHFTASSTADVYDGIDGKIGVHNTFHQFWFSYLAITDLDAFKTWLSTHNTTVYYALATPTDTEITDSDLIEQLNHIYSLYGGINNLWLIPSGGAQGEMTVSYATAEDIDYHEVVIDCQARTVTQDGHNLYPALADGSEFIRLVPGENKLYLTSEVESDDGTAEVKFKKGNISI